jgi:hypothetical protein
MTDVAIFGKEGCNDWKHASQQVIRHERSSNHRQAMVELLQFSDANSRIDAAKYFSVSVDSTPDVTHVDQLTCVLMYVLPSGPVERFATFLDMQGHTGRQLAESLLKFLEKHGIDIAEVSPTTTPII